MLAALIADNVTLRSEATLLREERDNAQATIEEIHWMHMHSLVWLSVILCYSALMLYEYYEGELQKLK